MISIAKDKAEISLKEKLYHYQHRSTQLGGISTF